MHGPEVVIEHVADWRPFSYITIRYQAAGIEDWAWTYRLERIDGGTRLTVLVSDPGSETWAQVGPTFTAGIAEQAGHLRELLDRSGRAASPA
jgi:hypothetical protein